MKTAKELRQLALNADDIKTETITSKHWPDFVAEARSMTIGAKIDTVQSVTGEDGNVDRKKLIPMMIIACVFDAEGKQVFEDADQEMLMKKGAPAIEEVWNVVARINGMGVEAVEGAEKN
jgi:hypothetical protein